MSGIIAIISQPPAEGLTGGDLEALGGAAALAAQTGEPMLAAVIGSGVGDAVAETGERGAERVFVADAEHLAAFSGDAVVDAAAAVVASSEASTVVIGRGTNTLELAPRLGARLGGGCVMGVTEVRPDADGGFAVVASVYGGSARAVYRLAATPRVLGLSPGLAAAPDREAGRSAEVVAVDAPAPAERVAVDQPAEAVGPRLEEANVVVSGGRGLQSGDNFALIRELAANLGGMPGASRAIVDEGWAPSEEQVGLTGKIVSPDLYVAAGISGASQHMMGCSTSRVLVGINTDRDAPIFRYARYGINGDALEVLPELIRLTRERAGG
ncbi:MAG: electron transfer flavoprotein subunit alpha/FixB family protein [Chloroflexota bacterium]|nr:electron transfer flavoprotein subunit alpha/FixB family protein [Chloroflexota bacterium]